MKNRRPLEETWNQMSQTEWEDGEALCKSLCGQAREVSLFVHALKGLWAELPWEDVEPHACRAWDSIIWSRSEDQPEHRDWYEVRDFVREAWLSEA